MNVPFSKLCMKETIDYLTGRIQQKKWTQVVTANPEIVMYAQNSASYMTILQEAQIIVPDGIGIVYAAKIQKDPVCERVAGYDLLHRIMIKADQYGWKVYLLGASEDVNQLAYEQLKKQYSHAILLGRHHGFFKDGSDVEKQIVEEIASLKPDILFVALGFPRQEEWISRHQPDLQIPLSMGVGGSFDVLSGKVKRAPLFWQKLGLEWFYRLISMPSRWRRMLVLPQFLLKQIFTKKNKNSLEKI